MIAELPDSPINRETERAAVASEPNRYLDCAAIEATKR